MGLGETTLRIIGALLALILVLFLAWLVLRWMGHRMPGAGGMGSVRQVQVLDRLNLGRSSGIVLVRVQQKVLLVGYSDHNVSTLAEFDDPDHKIGEMKDTGAVSFLDALKGAARQLKFGGKPDNGEEE